MFNLQFPKINIMEKSQLQ